jgi:hypothetical protein
LIFAVDLARSIVDVFVEIYRGDKVLVEEFGRRLGEVRLPLNSR